MNAAPSLSPPSVISPSHAPRPAPSPKEANRSRRWLGIGLKLGVFVVLAIVAFAFRNPLMAVFKQPPPLSVVARQEIVGLTDSRHIRVAADSPLAARLSIAQVKKVTIDLPMLSVTGSVIARLPQGRDSAESRWDFAAPEIATAYGDWIKAKADVTFNQAQVDKIRRLAKDRIDYLTEEYNRQVRLERDGTSTKQDVAKAKNEMSQATIQGEKDIHEAETQLKNAIRTRGLLERQLWQAGLDPEVMQKAKDGLVLVVADVPEARIELLDQLIDRTDMSRNKPCRARFFSFPDRPYESRVGRVGPSLAKDKRTLRVTFELYDPEGRLLPGMFADIGLGTQKRPALTVPADAVLHLGDHDYVLREVSPGEYRAQQVTVDEPVPSSEQTAPQGGSITVLRGLEEGERLVAAGAILLKPTLARAVNGKGH
jgi:hypothetical protein